MTSIRIAIATVLAAAAVFAGGTSHTTHSAASTGSHTVALAAPPTSNGPVLCCDYG